MGGEHHLIQHNLDDASAQSMTASQFGQTQSRQKKYAEPITIRFSNRGKCWQRWWHIEDFLAHVPSSDNRNILSSGPCCTTRGIS